MTLNTEQEKELFLRILYSLNEGRNGYVEERPRLAYHQLQSVKKYLNLIENPENKPEN